MSYLKKLFQLPHNEVQIVEALFSRQGIPLREAYKEYEYRKNSLSHFKGLTERTQTIAPQFFESTEQREILSCPHKILLWSVEFRNFEECLEFCLDIFEDAAARQRDYRMSELLAI